MPILPSGSTTGPIHESQGGSPRGWTFIGTGLACWRRFFLKYVFGLYPVKPEDALLLGAAFHLHMEGKPTEATRAFPEHAVEGQRLANVRKTRGPPLPRATAVEKEFSILDGMMTSKPDRIEAGGVVRDFKSSAFFSENDDKAWNVDIGILGECIAAGSTKAIVDITTKREDVSGPAVKLVKVTLTPEKQRVLEKTVETFWADLESRVTRMAAASKKGEAIDFFAPKALQSCVGKYGPCPYYSRCWELGQPASLFYRLTEKPPRRWVDFQEGPQPAEWTTSKGKPALEIIQSPEWRKLV